MRGRKTDSQFLSDFISTCTAAEMDTPELIVAYAKSTIANIDEEIKRMERQKIYRSKLLGVIEAFEKASTAPKMEEIKILSFFKIQNQQICKFICDNLKRGVATVEGLCNLEFSSADILFCVKQLLEHKVISKSGNHLLRGEMFDEYLKFVLRET
jgi:hypothetical protein